MSSTSGSSYISSMSSPTVFSRNSRFQKDKNVMGLDYQIKIFQEIFLVLVLLSGTIQGQSSEATTTTTTTTASPTTTSSTPETTPSPDRVWKTVDRSSYHGSASQPRPTYQKAPSSYSNSDRYSKQESSLRPSYSTSVRTSLVPVSSSGGSSSTYGSSSGSQAQVGSTTLIAIPVNAQMSGSTPTITLLPRGSQTSSRVVSSGSGPQYAQNIQQSSPYYQTSNLDSYYTSSYEPLRGSSSVSRPTYYGMPTIGSSSSSMAMDSYADSNSRYPSTTYFTEPLMADGSANSQMTSYYEGSKRPMSSESYPVMSNAKNAMSSMSSMPSMTPEALMSLMGSTKGSGMSSQMMMMPDSVKSVMMSDGGKSVMTPAEMMMMKSANIPEFIVMMPPKTVITPDLLLSLMSSPKPRMSMSPEMMMAMMGHGKKNGMMGMMMPPNNKMMMQQAMMAVMMKKKKEEEKEMSSISALLKKIQGLAKSLLSGGKKVKVITVKEGPALLHLLSS